MTQTDLRHVLDALEEAEAELEELAFEREWYVTDVIDRLRSAKQILTQEIANAS